MHPAMPPAIPAHPISNPATGLSFAKAVASVKAVKGLRLVNVERDSIDPE